MIIEDGLRSEVELTDDERHLLNLTATPAATLLGMVVAALRTSLLAEGEAAWVDFWQARSTVARLEWQDGPEIAEVMTQLAARTAADGTFEGVPGLRMRDHDDSAGELRWLGGAEPVTLHLTRLVS